MRDAPAYDPCLIGTPWLDVAKARRLFPRVREGWSKAKVRKLLGLPTDCHPERWRYDAWNYAGQKLSYTYAFGGDVVRWIERTCGGGVRCEDWEH